MLARLYLNRVLIILACLFPLSIPTIAQAAATTAPVPKENFPNRKAILLNNCPYVKLSDFSFTNRFIDTDFKLIQNLTWTNISPQPLVAFEVTIFKYDAFNRPMLGDRWVITGKNSGDWSPLPVGGSGSDGTISYKTEQVLTEIAFVDAARLADGTVWKANSADILSELHKVAPDIKELGRVKSESKQ